jgi:hypothetical protein
MKKVIITLIIAALFASGNALIAQNRQENYLGLPGDNLDLYAVMNLFQQSKTLEDFEKSLNDNNTNINNLDLNGDNQVDYIRVIDNVDGDVHNIVLQDAISPTENQDVAVFTVQRFNNGTVQIQLTGDEDLYGKNYIVEPIFDKETPNPGYNGGGETYVTTTPAQIAVWPVVRFIYLPTYTTWHSSWYWGYYPTYWHPWQPVSWHYYYGYQSNWDHIYYSHYRLGESHRSSGWHDYYYAGHRAYSPEVNHRIVTGTYKTTYSHPDQRNEGEAMFAKSHPEQYKSTHTSGNSSVHSIGNNNSGNSNGNNNSSNRRDNGSVLTNKNNSSATHSTGNNSGATRRPTNNVTNKTVVNPTTVKSTESARRPSSTVTNPSGVNRPTGKVNTSSGRSTVTNKSVTNPSAPQNVRTSTQSKTTTVSSSNRSTKQASKKSTTTKERKQDSDSKASDRR